MTCLQIGNTEIIFLVTVYLWQMCATHRLFSRTAQQ